VDSAGQIISYEEYYSYGSTSYQAAHSQTETPKRHRFTGKERDEESGLYYHGARYYAPWVGRWLSTDPIGIKDGLNLYQYTQSNPVMLIDSNGTQSEEQLAEDAFEGYLKEQKLNYKRQVPIKVKVNDQWVSGQADFLVERPGRQWEPVEFKGRDTSKWTKNQQKYLPALQQGAEFEVTGKFQKGYKGSGGGKVITLKSVADATRQFKKIFTAEYINRTRGIKVRTATDWEGNVVRKEKIPIDQKVKELARSRGMSLKNQGGFVRIGPMAFIAIATTAGIIIASEDRLDAVIELAKGSASDVALGALFFKLTKSAGMAGLLTMVVGMESDSSAHNEWMAKQRMINEYIHSNFSGVVSKHRYCDIFVGWLCTEWEYEAKDSAQYSEIYGQIESLVDNPYTFE
jgi:RHS repeat-associated protein